MKRSVKASLVAIPLVFATVLTATPAYADGSASRSGARTEYVDYGDILKSFDTAADGMSSVAQWRYVGGSAHTYWNTNGAGTSASWNLSITETAIEIRACVGEYGPRTIVGCSGWVRTAG